MQVQSYCENLPEISSVCMLIRRQTLKQGDPEQRLAFCNRFINTVERNPGFLDQSIVSDAAIFGLISK